MTLTKKSKNKTIPYIKTIMTATLLIFIIFSAFYTLGSALSYINAFNQIFGEQLYVDNSEFMEGNATRLMEFAHKFEKIKSTYHFPENLTGDGWDYYPCLQVNYDVKPSDYGIVNRTTYLEAVDYNPFNTSHPANTIKEFTGFGHAICFAGKFAIGDAFRYAAYQREKNRTGMEETKETLIKTVKAFSLLSEISDDGSMARYVYPDTPKARKYIDAWRFESEWGNYHLVVRRNFTRPNGKNYTFCCETGTSVDCYSGCYMGLGYIYKMCNDTEVRGLIRQAVDRMLTYHVNSGWKFIDADGKTHPKGAEALNAYPITDSSYTITFLRIGKTVHPEKWGPLYDDYVYNRLLSKMVGKHAQWDYYQMFPWGGRYFNVHLAISLAGTLCFFEDNEQLRNYYQEHFMESLWKGVKYHRNPWFELLYLLSYMEFTSKSYESLIYEFSLGKVPIEIQQYIELETTDTLMRMSLRKYPPRRFDHPNGLDSYIDNPQWSPIPGAPYPEVELFDWEKHVNMDNFIIQTFSPLYHPEEMWSKPVPIDWRSCDEWMWNDSPFKTEQNDGNGVAETTGGSYLNPYWIGRYLGFNSLIIDC
ncbi:MAG: hypothetical protein GF364_13220 [Candidatus Lokiarchaeota archaeon]|nr:hypothetical protein [Candidatus Lokiarchaeota archaeon]